MKLWFFIAILILWSNPLLAQNPALVFDFQIPDTIEYGTDLDITGSILNQSGIDFTEDFTLNYGLSLAGPPPSTPNFTDLVELDDPPFENGTSITYDFSVNAEISNGFIVSQKNIVTIWPESDALEKFPNTGSYVDTVYVKPETANAVFNLTFSPNTLNIAPNPGNGKYWIKVSPPSSSQSFILKVISSLGKCVEEKEIYFDGQILPIDLPHLNTGLYFLTLTNLKGQIEYQGRFIQKK